MPRKTAAIAAALKNKGMELDDNHHHMYRKQVDGVTTIVTRLSHGMDEIGDSLGKRMANQCYLQLKEFWNLVDCPLSEDEWDTIVRSRSVGGRNPFIGR